MEEEQPEPGFATSDMLRKILRGNEHANDWVKTAASTGVLSPESIPTSCRLLARGKRPVPIISTKASAVSGPNARASISRCAAGRFRFPARRLAFNPQWFGVHAVQHSKTLCRADWPRELTRSFSNLRSALFRLNSLFFPAISPRFSASACS